MAHELVSNNVSNINARKRSEMRHTYPKAQNQQEIQDFKGEYFVCKIFS
jgi:hypothetical protein